MAIHPKALLGLETQAEAESRKKQKAAGRAEKKNSSSTAVVTVQGGQAITSGAPSTNNVVDIKFITKYDGKEMAYAEADFTELQKRIGGELGYRVAACEINAANGVVGSELSSEATIAILTSKGRTDLIEKVATTAAVAASTSAPAVQHVQQPGDVGIDPISRKAMELMASELGVGIPENFTDMPEEKKKFLQKLGINPEADNEGTVRKLSNVDLGSALYEALDRLRRGSTVRAITDESSANGAAQEAPVQQTPTETEEETGSDNKLPVIRVFIHPQTRQVLNEKDGKPIDFWRNKASGELFERSSGARLKPINNIDPAIVDETDQNDELKALREENERLRKKLNKGRRQTGGDSGSDEDDA